MSSTPDPKSAKPSTPEDATTDDLVAAESATDDISTDASAADASASEVPTPDAVEHAADAESPTSPVDEESAPVEDDPEPVENESVSFEDEAAPVEDESAATEDDSVPVEDELSPVEDDAAPVEEHAVPADDVESEPEPEREASGPAAPVDPAPAPASSERVRGLMARPGRSQIVVGLLLAALGFAAVTQVRSTGRDDTFENVREEELIEIFNGLAGTSERSRAEISRLEKTRRDLQVEASARRAAIEQSEQRLANLNMLAGLVPVTGPGLRVTVTEEAGRISIDSLLDMLQELRTAGAEAMEVNGVVRVIASSSFSDEDGVIHLDGQPLRSPYVVEVIGEPHTLHTGLTFRSGPVSNLEKDENADVAIEELDSIDIETVRELPRPEFAEPAEGQ